jgi:hypothetical protein
MLFSGPSAITFHFVRRLEPIVYRTCFICLWNSRITGDPHSGYYYFKSTVALPQRAAFLAEHLKTLILLDCPLNGADLSFLLSVCTGLESFVAQLEEEDCEFEDDGHLLPVFRGSEAGTGDSTSSLEKLVNLRRLSFAVPEGGPSELEKCLPVPSVLHRLTHLHINFPAQNGVLVITPSAATALQEASSLQYLVLQIPWSFDVDVVTDDDDNVNVDMHILNGIHHLLDVPPPKLKSLILLGGVFPMEAEPWLKKNRESPVVMARFYDRGGGVGICRRLPYFYYDWFTCGWFQEQKPGKRGKTIWQRADIELARRRGEQVESDWNETVRLGTVICSCYSRT